jgi:hypothetical protein
MMIVLPIWFALNWAWLQMNKLQKENSFNQYVCANAGTKVLIKSSKHSSQAE